MRKPPNQIDLKPSFFKAPKTCLSRQTIYQSQDYSFALKLTGLIAVSILSMGLLVTAATLLCVPLIATGAVLALISVIATNHYVQHYKPPVSEDVPDFEPGIKIVTA